MITLILALLGTGALLLALWGMILAGWHLMLHLVDGMVERSRAVIQQERILQHLQALERQRRQLRRERSRQRRKVVDLDGQVRWLPPEEFAGFQRRCWAELGLPEGSSWAAIRQHWRRSSLRWHPDHGGDPDQWLRKQRAYQALEKARSLAGRYMPLQPQPLQLRPRRRRWRWRGRGKG